LPIYSPPAVSTYAAANNKKGDIMSKSKAATDQSRLKLLAALFVSSLAVLLVMQLLGLFIVPLMQMTIFSFPIHDAQTAALELHVTYAVVAFLAGALVAAGAAAALQRLRLFPAKAFRGFVLVAGMLTAVGFELNLLFMTSLAGGYMTDFFLSDYSWLTLVLLGFLMPVAYLLAEKVKDLDPARRAR
jgi:hypothetical protein